MNRQTVVMAASLAMASIWAMAPTAQAEPISLFLIGLGSSLGIGTLGGAAAAAASAGIAAGIGAAVGTAIVGSVITGVLGMAVKAIAGGQKPTGTPDVATQSRIILDNAMSTTNPIPVVFGSTKVGCQRVFFANKSSGNQKRSWLYVVATICEGPIHAIDKVLINDVDADSSFYVRDGLRRVDYAVTLGNPAGPYPAISSLVPEWTSAHKLTKLATIVCRFTLKSDNYDMFGSLPAITLIGRFATVFDFRDGVTKYSTNPALHVYHILTSGQRHSAFDGKKTFGFELSPDVMDEDAFIEAANFCDELVDNGKGGTQKRYELNGVIRTENRLIDGLDDLAKSFNAIILRKGTGLYSPLIIAAKAATFAITEDIIIPKTAKITRDGIRDKFNRVEVTYRNPDTNYEPDTVIWVMSDALALDDQELTLKLDLPFTSNRTTALQIGQIAVRQSRLDKKLTIATFANAMTCAIGDVVTVSFGLFNLVNAPFRVMGMQFGKDPTRVDLTLEEYDPDVYTLGAVGLEDLGDENEFDYPHEIQPPGVLSVTQAYIETGAGETQNQLIVEWADPASGFVYKYQSQYKLTSGTDDDWVTVETAQSRLILNNLPAGDYDLRVRALNTLNIASDWSVTSASVVGAGYRPEDVEGFVVTTSGGALNFSWAKNASVATGGQFRIKCIAGAQASISPGAWADAAIVDEILDGKQLSITFPMIEGTWLIKSRTRTGIECATAASVIVDIPEAEEWNTVSTVSEQTAYSGTKTDMVVASSKLKLDTGEIEGTYAFANTVDLGAVYNTRLRAFWTGIYLLASGTGFYEDRTGYYEDQTGYYQDQGSTPTVRVLHEFRSTRNDPSGSPTWGPWQQYSVMDVAARAFEFRTRVISDVAGDNVEIATLGVAVQLKRRVTTAALTTNAAGSAITFNRAFYSAPDVSAAMKNAATGDYVAVTAESRTGFTVRAYNTGGTGIARDVSWLAVGIGEVVS
jgi:hypothetical protein